jgi:hypothetical protein
MLGASGALTKKKTWLDIWSKRKVTAGHPLESLIIEVTMVGLILYFVGVIVKAAVFNLWP